MTRSATPASSLARMSPAKVFDAIRRGVHDRVHELRGRASLRGSGPAGGRPEPRGQLPEARDRGVQLAEDAGARRIEGERSSRAGGSRRRSGSSDASGVLPAGTGSGPLPRRGRGHLLDPRGPQDRERLSVGGDQLLSLMLSRLRTGCVVLSRAASR